MQSYQINWKYKWQGNQEDVRKSSSYRTFLGQDQIFEMKQKQGNRGDMWESKLRGIFSRLAALKVIFSPKKIKRYAKGKFLYPISGFYCVSFGQGVMQRPDPGHIDDKLRAHTGISTAFWVLHMYSKKHF